MVTGDGKGLAGQANSTGGGLRGGRTPGRRTTKSPGR